VSNGRQQQPEADSEQRTHIKAFHHLSLTSIDPGYGRFIKAMSALTTPHPIRRSLPRIVMRGTVSTAWCP
jgi:hypothetical protein